MEEFIDTNLFEWAKTEKNEDIEAKFYLQLICLSVAQHIGEGKSTRRQIFCFTRPRQSFCRLFVHMAVNLLSAILMTDRIIETRDWMAGFLSVLDQRQ